MATHPHLAERSVIISSFGKTYHVTGWRVGYCVAPAALMDDQGTSVPHVFCRYADAVRFCRAYAEPGLAVAGRFYQQKRDLLQQLLRDSPFRLLPSRSFFMLAELSPFQSDEHVARWSSG